MPIAKKFIAKSGAELEYVSLIDVYNSGNLMTKGRAHRLFKKVYNGIYEKAFPHPDERELFCDWVNLVETGGKELITFGTDLESDNPTIMGFMSCAVLGDSCCGMVDYRIRAKEYKHILSGQEISAKAEEAIIMMNKNLNGNKPLKMIVGEINDPAKIDWDENDPNRFLVDSMDPQKRYDRFISLGYEEIGIDYVQIQLSPDKKPCKTLILMQHSRAKRPNANAHDLERLIINSCKISTGKDNPYELNDPDVNKMMNQIAFMKENNIPIHKSSQTMEQQLALQYVRGGMSNRMSKFLISEKPKSRVISLRDCNWGQLMPAKVMN